MMQLQGPGGAEKKDDGWSGKGFIRFGLICVLVLGGGFGTWAATAKLAGAVIAMGQLRVEANRQVVQHLDGGIVGQILAQEGDVVRAGQVLIKLDETDLKARIAASESQYFEILARLGRLNAVQGDLDKIAFDSELVEEAKTNADVKRLMDGQTALFNARRTSMAKEMLILDQRKVQLREQIGGVQAQVKATNVQIDKIKKELKVVRGLFKKGLVSADRLFALEREEARLVGSQGELAQRIAEINSQIAETEIEQLRMFDTQREEAIAESRELSFRRLELRENLSADKQRFSRLEIKAPRPGTVIDSTVFALGAVIRPAEPIMYIIPTDTGLVVDARLEPTDIDSVVIGRETVLRFPALPTRTTPELFGKVTKIAADVTMDEQSGLQFYRVEVSIDDGEVEEKLEGQTLLAGMPVEAYVQTGTRTPLNYLVKPILDYFATAGKQD